MAGRVVFTARSPLGCRVIGFERLNFLSAKQRKQGASIPVEVQMV